MAQLLREVTGDNNKEKQPVQKEHLVEVMDRGNVQQLSRAELEQMKEREDIRISDQGDKATVLHKLRG